MIEIIPNWHPIFVHFTVALFSASVGFSVLSYIVGCFKSAPEPLVSELEIGARWCLWAAALATIGTLLAGLYAYYTVKHDAVSHAAMTVHRNWALSTAVAIFLIACWSLLRYFKQKKLTASFVIALLVAQGLLLSTAWHGGELVYRYGVGVMSLPQAEEVGHQHSQKMMETPQTHPSINTPSDNHQHSHDAKEHH